MRKIVQVLTFQIFIWFYNATLSFIVIKNQSGKGTFWTPCMYKDCLGIMKEQCKNSRLPHLLMIVVHGETLWSPAPQPMDDDDDDELRKMHAKNAYLGSIFIPEKCVIRVLFVCPWTSLIPPSCHSSAPPAFGA